MAYSIIDVDTHITEPADTWTSRVAASLSHFSPEDRHQLLWGNAEKLYRVESPA